jgi:hypothetical protein
MKNWCGGPWQGLIGLHSGSGGRRKKLEGGHTYIFFLHSSNYDKSLPIDSQYWSLIHLYEMCTIIWKEFASLLHDFRKVPWFGYSSSFIQTIETLKNVNDMYSSSFLQVSNYQLNQCKGNVNSSTKYNVKHSNYRLNLTWCGYVPICC